MVPSVRLRATSGTIMQDFRPCLRTISDLQQARGRFDRSSDRTPRSQALWFQACGCALRAALSCRTSDLVCERSQIFSKREVGLIVVAIGLRGHKHYGSKRAVARYEWHYHAGLQTLFAKDR